MRANTPISLRTQFRRMGAMLLLVVVVYNVLMLASVHLWRQGEAVAVLARGITNQVHALVGLTARRNMDNGVQVEWTSYQAALRQDVSALPEEFAAEQQEARRLLLWSQDIFSLLVEAPSSAAAEPRLQAMHATLLSLSDVVAEIETRAQQMRKQAIYWGYAVHGVGVLGIFFWVMWVGWFLRGHVVKGLVAMAQRLRTFGQDDLGERLPRSGLQEFDDLAQAYNQNVERLATTLVSRDALRAEVQARTLAQEQTRQAYQVLQSSMGQLELAASVFSNAVEGVMITDTDSVILDVNQAFCSITGYSREEAVGQTPKLLRSGRHDRAFYEVMWQALTAQGNWSGEIWNRTKDGRVFPEYLSISAVKSEQGTPTHYIGYFQDITDTVEARMQLEQLARFDALTQLPNRMLLTDRLEQALLECDRTAQSVAIVFLDLDGFKEVNDSYDHQTGDALLVALTQRMREALRGADTLARLGGDEFVAVLRGVHEQADVDAMVQRLLRAAHSRVQLQFQGREISLQVSASAGVTLYPADHSPAGLLIRHADQAMYQAKQAGKNRFQMFDLAFDAQVKSDLAFVQRVQTAIERQELVLYYQPKLDLSTGAIYGVEALVRWNHPERGLLSPGEFLPQIEAHPVNEALGEWVLAEAMAQRVSWQLSGMKLAVSINISARQLHSPYFFERLADLLSQYPDLAPGDLELEVLETSALQNLEKVTEVMQACMGLGVQFALDDFGTGYSTLTYLKRLPAKTLKIDQSFVRNMLIDPSDRVIVQGVIGMATTFGRSVIAEGVETVRHARELLRMGCQCAQGYAIAPPMQAKDLELWLRDWRPTRFWADLKAKEGQALAGLPSKP